jgi:hypothetical protein
MQTKFMIHPISLVHSPSKLISKTLSRRLTPHMCSSASTRILLNGTPGGRICHAQGFAWLLTPLQLGTMKYTVFLYADDMVIFLASVQQDARVVRMVLELFASSSGLRTNISKCMLTPIRCGDQLPM